MLYGGIPIALGISVIGNFQRITVTGDVVLHEARPGIPEATAPAHRVDVALNNAAGTLVNTIPQGASVAILNVQSNDLSTAEFVMVGLEYRLFVARRFVIVDRVRLDQIRHEQHLHISGEVDDASAVSIGQILGASIVITGSVGDDAMGGWLVLRALDVQTGQVMAMAMQRF
ncbi:MAG: CsgG/HfaB family protein [Treponema sp.]|nr:CsgG/HfaB family protein [Treponema sp.]